MQGSDVYDESTGENDYVDMPTFSKEDGGTIKAFNNYMTGERRFVAYGADGYPNSTIDFDAYVASTRDEQVGSSVVSAYGSNTYNNFDTDQGSIYSYEPDSPEAARDKVIRYAGRMNGGDFEWTFNNAVDDASYDVNSALKAALTGYETSLVSIQGDTISSGGGGGGGTTEGDEIHNFTLSGLASTFYGITGNLSDSKGTVTYDGLTLTWCLKIESITVITFTITEEATLTLVFNDGFSGKIKINGTSYSAVGGVLTRTLQAGDYEITKDETANLFYMSITYTSSGIKSPSSEKFMLYPNPVKDMLYISSLNGFGQINLYNQTGILVKVFKPGSDAIDMSDLSSGIYVVTISTEQGLFRKVVVKQ